MNPYLSWLRGTIPQFVNANLDALGQLPRDQLGQVRLTSWFRSAADNARVGGAAQSQHRLALATDWVVPDRLRFMREMQRQNLVAIDEGDHVHVQAFTSGALSPVFSALFGA
ncbi:unnamed protein product [marine sediment metagenome]|uniref:Peptidase M15A C-terminal domain-containing protein n=1 Tax=marine sediment metagenome TaxID=412755 RepID=X1C9R6_9ZZZZ